jgi:hypothetical protein
MATEEKHEGLNGSAVPPIGMAESNFDRAVVAGMLAQEQGLAKVASEVRELKTWQKAAAAMLGPVAIQAIIAGLEWLTRKLGG